MSSKKSYAVLVAGGAGYIGTHMIKALIDAGHTPITIDNLSTGHEELLPGGEFIKGSIDDGALLDTVFQRYPIDAVMHFAAFIEVGESVSDPIKYHLNNVAAATGKREYIKIFGSDYPTLDGTCIRDYIHVNDLAGARLLALSALMDGNPSATYNLGNSKGYAVREVLETARTVTGKNIPIVEAERRPGDPAVLVADAGKIRAQLGWKPKYEDLGQIIQTAWNWHQKNNTFDRRG
jgi:UDP-glucose 4-epimerase